MKHLKKWNSWEVEIINGAIFVMGVISVFMCGWIFGRMSSNAFVDTYKEIEYIYVTEPCFREHVEDSVQSASIEPVEAPESAKLYSDEDAIALAQTLYGEARGVKNNGVVSSTCQKAAVVWCVLNRYDASYEDSIVEVCAAEKQFHGYSSSHPVWDDLLEIAYDVLDRWNAEKNGETDVGRVLPSDYYWFAGDGEFNYFRNEYDGGTRWNWSLGDPYQ